MVSLAWRHYSDGWRLCIRNCGLFADSNIAFEATYNADGGAPQLIRMAMRRADEVTGFGEARPWSETARLDLRLAEVPEPRPGDRVEIEGAAFLIQGEPVRDRERLVWPWICARRDAARRSEAAPADPRRRLPTRIDCRPGDDKSVNEADGPGGTMRQKLRECVDETGNTALVIEWGFAAPGARQVTNRELRLEDGSPVSPLGGAYEHFYSGRILRPA